jgi:threonyl-tRNA synthetase
MAAAVQELYPGTKFGIGPSIENGFYYDFEFKEPISLENLPKIEKKMKELLSQNIGFKKEIVSKPRAKKLFKDQKYKLELIEEMKGKISIYQNGQFVDLCKGPHVRSTKQIPQQSFKLTRVAGAYWRGDENNPMLTRIYGVAFESKKELKKFLKLQGEAEKRDHRKLGQELEIYLYSDLVGPGLPIYQPNGGVIIDEIQNFMGQLQKELGYQHVFTPHLAKEDLFQTSGHLQWFKEGMYPPMEFKGEGNYYAKPMNCPFHIQIYKNKIRSYRDLPIKYAEFGTVYRYEKSGEISGLLRTRGFTQDDAHIFCREDQVIEEFIKVFQLTSKLLKALGLANFRHRLSLRGKEKEKYAGNEGQWKRATQLIRQALIKKGIDCEEVPGEAAFYGPKLDILFTDALGREWQISTIQVDFLLPERFNMFYVDSKGRKQRPFMIHRAPLGSRERIMAILLEHHAGAFPLWLAPIQVSVVPVGSRHRVHAQKIGKALKERDIRVVVRDEAETVAKKIREGETKKIPYMAVVGDEEIKTSSVRVRKRHKGDIGLMKLERFIEMVQKEKEAKK